MHVKIFEFVQFSICVKTEGRRNRLEGGLFVLAMYKEISLSYRTNIVNPSNGRFR